MSSVKGLTLTLIREAEQESLQLPAARVRLRRPGREDVERPLGLEPVVIGSHPDCELVVDDPYVSRRHCQLSLTERGVLVKDLGSRNGTLIGPVRVVEALLPADAELVLGQARVTVTSAGEAVRVPLAPAPRFGEALGHSPVMRALFERLRRAAATDDSVLLLGESGTGKELLARAVHDASPRKDGPFVVLDCGAVAPSLIESELFGHEKGAFSGAHAARRGILESANGGTVFLDEIGELPLDLQPRLLRALESRQVRPVGANGWRPLDVRVVAATHRDVRARIAAGELREDLFYRLAVVEARVPPLRERPEDIPLLVEHLLAQRSPPTPLDALPPNALELLKAHRWPGNVRELRNTLARLVLFQTLGEPAAPAPPEAGPAQRGPLALPFHEAREAVLEDFERRYASEHLRTHEGNVSAAARTMGVSRQFLHKLIARYGLRAPE